MRKFLIGMNVTLFVWNLTLFLAAGRPLSLVAMLVCGGGAAFLMTQRDTC